MIGNDSRPPMAAPAPLAYAEAEREPVQRPTLDLLLLLPWMAAVAGLFLPMDSRVASAAQQVMDVASGRTGTTDWLEAILVWPLGLSIAVLGWKVRLRCTDTIGWLEQALLRLMAIAGLVTPLMVMAGLKLSAIPGARLPMAVVVITAVLPVLTLISVVGLKRRRESPARVTLFALGAAYATSAAFLLALFVDDVRVPAGQYCMAIPIAGWIAEGVLLRLGLWRLR